jgi:hypothetical protein
MSCLFIYNKTCRSNQRFWVCNTLVAQVVFFAIFFKLLDQNFMATNLHSSLGHFEKPDGPTIQKEGRSGYKPYEFDSECLQSTNHEINKGRIFL